MTNGAVRAFTESLQQRATTDWFIVAAGFIALIVGFFVGSSIGLAIGVLLCMAAGAYVFLVKRGRGGGGSVVPQDQEGSTDQPLRATMKTLLFDDFQNGRGRVLGQEIEGEDRIVPSTKTAKPVSMALKEERLRSMEIPDFFDLEAGAAYTETEPKTEFHGLLDKVLLVLKDVLFAHSVAFFWANGEKKVMVLETMATDSGTFLSTKRFPLEHDIVSQVARTGKPQVLGTINPASEREVLPYYDSPAGVHSVLAVPVFFSNGSSDIVPVGVVVADSLAEDQFGAETVVLSGRFTKLISSLIRSYTDKYDLLLDAELLAAIRRLHDRVGTAPTEENVLAALLDEANRLAAWDALTVVMYSEEHSGWIVQKAVSKLAGPMVAQQTRIDPDASIVGEVIRTNAVKTVDNLAEGGVPRFTAGEESPGPVAFLAVPISSFNRCYGALTMESRTLGCYRGREAEKIYRLVQTAAGMLEVVYMNDMIREHLPVDNLTGAASRKHFLRRLEEEVQRANDLALELSLVHVAVDGFADQLNRFGKESVEAGLCAVTSLLRSGLRPYDLVGRLEESTFAVILVNTVANDAYLWAEKLRKQIASHVIATGTKTHSLTVSFGISGLMEGETADELTAAAEKLLARALEQGGNNAKL